MRQLLLLSVVMVIVSASVRADEIADALRAALEAYQAGDVATAQEEASYASQLLAQKKAAGLADFLPEALANWTRTLGESQAHAGMVFGGGLTAEAIYTGPEDARIQIQLLADSPVASMFANPALMSAFGQVRRINRVNFAIDQQGEIKGMVGNVLVQVSGSAPEADKIAYIEKMDLRALASF